mgnify:CR=1 FL=1
MKILLINRRSPIPGLQKNFLKKKPLFKKLGDPFCFLNLAVATRFDPTNRLKIKF